MWSPLSKLFAALGRIRLPWLRTSQRLAVGDPRTTDALGSRRWKEFLSARELARVWGPAPDGPWWPFHCLTLFAALDYLEREQVGPLPLDPLPMAGLRHRLPEWLDGRTLLLVDLPGPQSAALGAALALQGCELVCTFNNWPRPKALLASEGTLGALLRYAAQLAVERVRPSAPAPVAWLCDNERLGTREGRPGEFDNRYYIEESALPGHLYLRERGVTRLVYLGAEGRPVTADLVEYLLEYRIRGFDVLGTRLAPDGRLATPFERPLGAPSFNKLGYHLAAGGGFGASVPHPSSGG